MSISGKTNLTAKVDNLSFLAIWIPKGYLFCNFVVSFCWAWYFHENLSFLKKCARILRSGRNQFINAWDYSDWTHAFVWRHCIARVWTSRCLSSFSEVFALFLRIAPLNSVGFAFFSQWIEACWRHFQYVRCFLWCPFPGFDWLGRNVGFCWNTDIIFSRSKISEL